MTGPNASLEDLTQDFKELAYLTTSAERRLAKFRARLRARPSHYRPDTQAHLLNMVDAIAPTYVRLRNEIDEILKRTHPDTSELIAAKKRIADLLRASQGVLAAVINGGDWESPSFGHSFVSQAGRHTGKIMGTINDYKRDHHRDADAYERAFRSAYIDTPASLITQAYATASGMAAFSTILNYLLLNRKTEGKILIGRASYFENKGLVEKMFRGRVIEVNEFDAESIVKAVKEHRPSIIFLDSLCNTEDLAMPDLPTLIPRIASAASRETHLVLDNSGMASAYQPLRDFPLVQRRLKLIVFESLNKYHQFGFDRVTGGIIWTPGISISGLFGMRIHVGTNIPDASVLALPEPNRTRLDARLARFERNATRLASALETFLQSQKFNPVAGVVYPGLPSYSGYAWTKDRPFHGSFFVLAFRPKYQKIWLYQACLTLMLAEAKKEGLDLTTGTSFGFNTTRAYLTALHADHLTKPFLRVSVGTETVEEIDAFARAFSRALKQLTTLDRLFG